MSRKPHNHHSQKPEHGTYRSYVIGFVLSLVLTLVPYFLVVNKVISGSTLLMAILAIAVLQMFVQIFFFLHLGRGPKPFYNIVFFIATAGVIIVVVGASIFIMNNLYRNMSPDEMIRKLAQKENIAQVSGEATGACQGNKNNHIFTIRGGVVTPAYIKTERCDTLTLINEDARERAVTFGTHPAQESYGGEHEIVLPTSEPETITLNEVGDFKFHDHHDPLVGGYFTVFP